jgi:hypothetical protein
MTIGYFVQHSAVPAAGRPALAWLLVSGAGGALAALVVAGVIAGRLGVPISGPLLLAAATIGALPQAATIARLRWRVCWPELAATLVGLTALGGAGLALAWPTLLPLGLSVDAVHHTQLVAWIAENNALPEPTSDLVRRLGEMAAYPVGLALVAFAAGALAGRAPVEVLYPVVALLGALIAALVVLLSRAAGDRAYAPVDRSATTARSSLMRFLALLVGPLLLLAHRTYLLNAYIDHSYYTMVLGVALVLLAGAWLIVEPRRSFGAAAQAGVALAALACTYPLWVPVPAALAVIAIRPRSLDQREPVADQRSALVDVIGRLMLTLGPALVLGWLDVLPRLRIGQAVLAHEGLVTMPTVQRLIPILLALPCALVVARGRRGRYLLALAGLAALALLALGIAARAGLAASYHSFKLLFVLTPIAAAIVGAAAVRLICGASTAVPEPGAPASERIARIFGSRAFARSPQIWPLLGAAILALALVLTGSYSIIPSPSVQVLTPDMVAAASWLRATAPREAERAVIIGAPTGPMAYWLQLGLLGQRRDRATGAAQALTTAPPSPESWLVDPQLPPIAIIPHLDAPLPGMTVAARFGPVAIVRRAAQLDSAALNPLTIRYKTFWEEERLKTAIEVLRKLPGPLPLLEIALYHAGAPISAFALPPDQDRIRTQYLGADLLPSTLGGNGYINDGAYPTFAPPPAAPTGALTLTLRLSIAGNIVDERLLATFDRTSGGQITDLAPSSGELIYVRQEADTGEPLIGSAQPAVDFEGIVRLDEWHVSGEAAPDALLAVELRWRAPRPIERALFPEVLVLDPQGQTVAASLEAPQGGFYPTWRWRTGESVPDRRELRLPADLAPGVYRIAVRIHDFAGRHDLAGGTRADAKGLVELATVTYGP